MSDRPDEEFPDFEHPVQIEETDLQFEPFRNRRQTQGFRCGDPNLDDFILTDQAEIFQAQSLGYTTLAYYHGDLVAYYTTSMDGLRYDHLKKRKPLGEPNYLELEVYPALKIGRLAVHEDYQNKGIGRIVMDRIIRFALAQQAACRLIILNARPDSIRFYQKYGFVLSDFKQETREEKLMFFDLDYVRNL